MVPYVDSKGVIWSIDPPGTSMIDVDGHPEPNANWTASITSDAYGHAAGEHLAVATDEQDIRSAIESYIASPSSQVVKPKPGPDAPGQSRGSKWWLVVVGGLWWWDQQRKKRRR